MRWLRIAALAAVLFTACGRSGIPAASHLSSASPSPLASPTPLSRPLGVSASTPVILYHDPAAFDQLDGLTWDGAVRGKVGSGVAAGGTPNAQGTMYAADSVIRNREGRVVAAYSSLTASIYWADDGVHYCGLDRTASRDVASIAQLEVAIPGQAARTVARVGAFAPAGFNGGGPYLVACGIASDRAIVVQSGGQGLGTRQFWVVQLSTGRVLWTRTPSEPVQLVASHDGSLIAENVIGAGRATVYSPTGSLLARVNGWVNLFSWNGSLAVVSGGWTSGPVAITRWRDGSAIWNGPAGTGYGYWEGVAEPGGARLALGLRDPQFPQTGGFAPVDLYVVSSDGTIGVAQKNLYLVTPP